MTSDDFPLEIPALGLESRFQSVRPLGPRGTTFAALDTTTGKEVVVKKLVVGVTARDWKEVELFEREQTTLSSLDHPAIPKLLEHAVSDDGVVQVLVMEMMAGASLADHVARGTRWSREELAQIVSDLLDILEYLHRQVPAVVHRDIKPSNIILGDGVVSLVDFGSVARAARGETTVGTFGYMAPEQLYGEATPASDLYALGMTILAIATALEPEDFPRVGLVPIIPTETFEHNLELLLSDLTQQDPRERPQSAKEAKRRLSGPVAVVPAKLQEDRVVGKVGTLVRRDIGSAQGLSSWEVAALVGIPITAAAPAIAPILLAITTPALIVGAAVLHRGRNVSRPS